MASYGDIVHITKVLWASYRDIVHVTKLPTLLGSTGLYGPSAPLVLVLSLALVLTLALG